jgi:hypothetical protein
MSTSKPNRVEDAATLQPGGRYPLVHIAHEDETVALCGTPVRFFYLDGPGVDCVVCADLDREES